MGQTPDNRISAEDKAALLDALLRSAVDAILTIDQHGMITSANPSAEKLFQYSEIEMIGQNVSMLMADPHKSAHDGYIRRYLATGEARIIGLGREVPARRKDGSSVPIHLSVSEFVAHGERYFAGIIHDLSGRKDAERALNHAQKMEAIGQLTGGVAHDFNNLLTVIIGNLELLEMRLEEKGARELLDEAQEAADLGAKLTARLLAFARRSPLESVAIDLNDLILGLTDLLHRTLGGAVDLSTVLSTHLGTTRADPGQIETAIVNLALNARDAMPDGGTLVLETRNAVIDEDYIAGETGLEPGNYVLLSVSDTGHGMGEDVRERVFEPFFTTKEAGKGSGLGLPMIYGFAKQSGGHVTIYSEIGKGTTVNLYLPRLETEADEAGSDEPDLPVEETAGGCILVVEDDPRIRRLTRTRLESLGYDVLQAENGPEALSQMEQHGRAVDLVFTDLVMPGGMSGYDLCAVVRERYPGVRLLLTSGYAEETVHAQKLAEEQLAILRKPYRQSELARAISDVLMDDC